MKRIAITLAIIFSILVPGLVLVSGSAAAVSPVPDCGNGSAAGSPDICNDVNSQGGNNGTNNPVVTIIKEAINILSFIIGVGAVIGIVVSGFRIITAGGDSQAVASARSGLIYSLAGLAVAALAQALVAFVLDKIG
jgi:hypothetical protein